MTKNERIAELEREVAELRLELQRLASRQVPVTPYQPGSDFLPPNWWRGPVVSRMIGGAGPLLQPEIAHFTYENGQTKFLAMERASC